MIYTTDNHADAVAKLTQCHIPVKEVFVHTSEGKKPALKLDVNAFIMIQAGTMLTDN